MPKELSNSDYRRVIDIVSIVVEALKVRGVYTKGAILEVKLEGKAEEAVYIILVGKKILNDYRLLLNTVSIKFRKFYYRRILERINYTRFLVYPGFIIVIVTISIY